MTRGPVRNLNTRAVCPTELSNSFIQDSFWQTSEYSEATLASANATHNDHGMPLGIGLNSAPPRFNAGHRKLVESLIVASSRKQF